MMHVLGDACTWWCMCLVMYVLGDAYAWWCMCLVHRVRVWLALVEHMLGDAYSGACVMQEGVHTNLAEFSSLIGPFRIQKKKNGVFLRSDKLFF